VAVLDVSLVVRWRVPLLSIVVKISFVAVQFVRILFLFVLVVVIGGVVLARH
jgi:hypothetical protein